VALSAALVSVPSVSGYAEYRLTSVDNELIARGHKAGYCMEDSNQQPTLQGPNINCRPTTTCEAPGISAGWSDVYGNDIDCQWVSGLGRQD
jgi:hypothetical protein